MPNASARKPSSASKIVSASTMKAPKPYSTSTTAKPSTQIVDERQKENKAPRVSEQSATRGIHKANGSNKRHIADTSIILSAITKLETEKMILMHNNGEQIRQYSVLRV